MKFAIEHIKPLIIVLLSLTMIILVYRYFIVPKTLPPPFPVNDIEHGMSKELSGIIMQYGSNPSGDIDKFLIEQNNQQTWLHFPPHTAMQVLNIAKIHSSVKITMTSIPDKKDVIRNELRSLTGNNNQTIIIRDIAPPPPTHGNETIVSGNSLDIKRDDKGKAKAFVLSGKLIALPPHVAEALIPLIKRAKKIVVKGYERDDKDGFVNIDGHDVIRPYAITIDSVNYLVH